MQTLHHDIVGLLYDIKELCTVYRGNLIALSVGLAVAVFNYNRPNEGMFFIFWEKRSTTMISNMQTLNEYNISTFEETTVGITQSTTEGIFSVFLQMLLDF